jgi:hypothetical protein
MASFGWLSGENPTHTPLWRRLISTRRCGRCPWTWINLGIADIDQPIIPAESVKNNLNGRSLGICWVPESSRVVGLRDAWPEKSNRDKLADRAVYDWPLNLR